MGVFAWCAIIGCTVLVAGILFDGLLDALLPDGLVPILALPVAVFGAIGMGVTATTGSAAAQVPAAVLWGVPTAAALMRWLWNRLRRSMPLDTAPPTPAELVGEKVTVLWWKDGSGEVRAVTRGHPLTLPAHSEQPLRSGQSAWVLDAVDSTLAIVPWEQISD